MGREVTIVDEFGERVLHGRRHDLTAVTLSLLDDVDEPVGDDGVAGPDIREGRFREGADIENATGVVEPLQGSDRPAVIVELAVIVVLDDRRADRRCERENLLPSFDGHQLPGRILVRRRHEDQPRPIASPRDRQSAAIEAYSRDAGAGRFESRTRPTVAGAFHPGEIAGIEQHPRNEVDRCLSRRRDDDLSRVGLDTPILGQMPEQRRLQRRTVQGRHAGSVHMAGSPPKAARPKLVRKFTCVGHAGSKWPRAAFVLKRPIGSAEPLGPA